MTIGEVIIGIVMIVGFIIIGLINRTPEHLLNRNLESYKNELQQGLEELKKDLSLEISNEEAREEQKRIVYTNLVISMSIFIGGRVIPQQYETYKQNFYNNYDTAWLWASDEVMKVMSKYMQFKIDNGTIQEQALEKPNTVPNKKILELKKEEKELFLDCIFAMRKDVFSNTNLSKKDYKFIKF